MKDCDSLELPSFPQTEDVWKRLASEKRPIVVYGMGNGGDKLVENLEKYSVEISDFFASDGFVRGQLFHGKRVLSFAEIKEKYADFVIAVAFASNRQEVISRIRELDSEYDVYIPDMPVMGEEYFTCEFYNEHYEEILSAYSILGDDKSKKEFSAVIRYKLSGKFTYLEAAKDTAFDMYQLVKTAKIDTYIDAGAYNGDSLRELLEFGITPKKVFAIEPDPKTYKRLLRYAEGELRTCIVPVNAALWSECGVKSFFSSGNRNSSISNSSYEAKENFVKCISIDSLTDFANYIKYDVEGAELEALCGSVKIIERARPILLVSAYHRSRDIYTLPEKLKEICHDYVFLLRRRECFPAWEINLFAIPKEYYYA